MFSFEAAKTGRVALVAAAFALAAGGNAAFAQDTSTGTPPPPARQWHGHFRGGGGDPLAGTLMHLKTQLALNSSQQGQWDSAVAQAKAVRAQIGTLRKGVMTAFDTEIAKDQPDLASVAATADAARTQSAQLAQTVRDGWLAVYANLSPTQKSMVVDALRARVAQMQQMRAAHNAGS